MYTDRVKTRQRKQDHDNLAYKTLKLFANTAYRTTTVA